MKLHPIEAGNFKLDGGAMFGVVPKTIWNKTNPADENNLIDIGDIKQLKIDQIKSVSKRIIDANRDLQKKQNDLTAISICEIANIALVTEVLSLSLKCTLKSCTSEIKLNSV